MRGIKPKLSTDDEALQIAPKPPAWLSKAAVVEWKRVIPTLIERRILVKADMGSVENYCTAIGQVREMEKHLQEHGHVIIVGAIFKRNPAVGIQSDAMTRARLLASELGLTPVSRSRPSIREDSNADSLLDN